MKRHSYSEQFTKYNELAQPERAHLLKSAGINHFMTETSHKKLHAYLLAWTCFSIKMTEQVESWITRSGESCQKKNFNLVGERLKYHASQEAEHDNLLKNDLKFLIQKWNDYYSDQLTEADILKIGAPLFTNEYVNLHENTINGEHPYTQVAIEYEIERISIMFGPFIIENIIYTLGSSFNAGITFLTEHVLLDQGHTKFNIDLLEKCFTSGADLDQLINTGRKALQIYAGFLNDCMKISNQLCTRNVWQQPTI